MNNIIDNNAEIVNNIREIYSIAPANKLRELIEKHFIPTQEEKKDNAEIPTPVKLVDDMLNIVPVEFWKKPHRVLEPCCGKGNFVLGIFDRFYKGLEEIYPDEIERCRVIMTECIYYADLTALNVFITTEIMKCHVQSYCGLDELNFEFNNYTGNTLEIDVYSIWKINNFDAVIGNPPYQPPSNDKKGGTSIWNKFVSLSLSKLLKERGYLVFVHPALWRKPDNKLRDEMFLKQIHYLSIHSDSDGNKMFGATTRFDYYLLENTPTYKTTRVMFEDKKEYDILITKTLPFIPNFGWSIFDKVFKKLNNNGIIVNRDSDCHTSRSYVSKLKTNEYKYQLLNSISKTKGKTFCYSSRPHKVHYNKKVLFSNGRHIVPFYDNGELGVTEGGLYTIVNDENEGKKLVEYLNSNLVVYLMKATKWSNFETSKQLFWYIPLPTDIHNVNNPNVNTYFDLTQEEIITISK
jgi:SAM-dependent methyltransferase